MREFWRKLTRLDQRDELARRLREELEFHIEMKVSQSGLTACRARCELGNQARILEEANKIWSFPFIEHIWFDCRHAARVLLKSPAFFILVATGTGLGVAAITSVSSVADVMLIRALPYRDSGRLMVIRDQLLNLGFPDFRSAMQITWTIEHKIMFSKMLQRLNQERSQWLSKTALDGLQACLRPRIFWRFSEDRWSGALVRSRRELSGAVEIRCPQPQILADAIRWPELDQQAYPY